MQMVIVLAILVLVGFSQVLLPLLSLHVAVDAEESEVPDEERPTTRLGVISQALFTFCSSDATKTLLPILGIRGPIDTPLPRPKISSMLTVYSNYVLRFVESRFRSELECSIVRRQRNMCAVIVNSPEVESSRIGEEQEPHKMPKNSPSSGMMIRY